MAEGVVQMRLARAYERASLHGLFRLFVTSKKLRGAALPFVIKLVYKKTVGEDDIGRLRRVQEDKYYLMVSILRSVDRGLARGAFSKNALEKLYAFFVEKVVLNDGPRRYKEETGRWPPAFITMSPTGRCNLGCTGCYAGSRPQKAASLPYDVAAEVISQKRRLWGSFFTVISGGEPFLWDGGGGKGIFDLAADFPDEFFLVFTNGTLIDAEVAARLERLGNVTPAISVEGFEAETDRRRGRGVFRKILAAFGNLRNAGVPFGISITVARGNVDVILSREFSDFFFRDQGAIYGWVFQYMPIGRAPSLAAMVTPEQRMRMFRRTTEMVRNEGLFVVDFWNSGPLSNGCIAAGRPFGYCYVDWAGNVTPCVFVPYAAANVHEIFARGGSLDEVLDSGLFKDIRRWQTAYGYDEYKAGSGDWIAPCVNRDHYRVLREALTSNAARPTDESAAAALADDHYCQTLAAYGDHFRALADDVWQKEYLARGRAPRSTV
jgi:MoaA/NifB/PqqE/SkfB family radical SAM enzyme